MVGFVCDLEKTQERGGHGQRWPATPQVGGKGEILRFVYGSCMKEQRIPWTVVCGYEMKKFRYINLCDTMITLSITLKYQALRFDYL